jgi:hypothetical protein
MSQRHRQLLIWAAASAVAGAWNSPARAQTTAATTAPAATTPATAPATAPVRADASAQFVASLERAHGIAAWRTHEAIETTMRVTFGESTAIDGTVLFDQHGGRVRIEQRDGTLLVFDGEKAWVSPPEADFQAARFHLLTWPYFLAAPFKLRDPGTHLEPLADLTTHGESHPAARLTFDDGVGDAPDDWYILYREPETDRRLCERGRRHGLDRLGDATLERGRGRPRRAAGHRGAVRSPVRHTTAGRLHGAGGCAGGFAADPLRETLPGEADRGAGRGERA